MSKSRTDFVYGHLLEALSGGLYPNKLDIVREYVQNSYDAIRERLRNTASDEEQTQLLENLKIDVAVKAGSLFVHDNALGMDFETLNEYRKLGFSRKAYGEYAGWRGIGKAAGLAVAEKLIVTTSRGKGEEYQLVVNAKEMTDEVYRLRSKGQNIPFNELMEKYSSIAKIQEGNSPFTTVELNKVKPEAKDLLNKSKLSAHLSLLAPVPFRTNFRYAQRIQTELKMALEEYFPIKLFVEGEQIFKPYVHEWKEEDDPEVTTITEPSFLPIYDEEKLIAFCWYCMNTSSKRIKTRVRAVGDELVSVGGLLYRVDDIKVGDAHLTRSTLWTTTPQRSLWAVGEVHVLDKRVEPTSDRNDFIDNYARSLFFRACNNIARDISRKAASTSEESRAKVMITKADERINQISKEIAEKKVPKEMLSNYIYEAIGIKKEAEKRKTRTSRADLKRKADQVVSVSEKALKQLTDAMEKPSNENRIYQDISEELQLSDESKKVYGIIVDTLRDYYANDPTTYQDIVRRIIKALAETLGG